MILKADHIEWDLALEIMDFLSSKENKRDHLMFALGFYTGLRISDILKLKVKDVMNLKEIEVVQKKTGSKIEISIHPYLRNVLKDFIKDKEEYEALFRSRQGFNRSINTDTAYKKICQIGDLFGVKMSCHTLRKTGAMRVYDVSGKDIVAVTAFLGQKDSVATMKYLNLTKERRDMCIKRM